MKYKVRIGYTDFIFEDGEEAIKFAETAVKRLKDDDKEVTVTIYYEEEDENED
jgi:hypothetical protein